MAGSQPFLPQFHNALHHEEPGAAGANRVVLLLEWSAPESHDGIADVFVECALSVEDDASHVREVSVEKHGEDLGVKFFGDGGEVADVGEHHSDFGLARLNEFGLFEQTAYHFRA